MQRALIVLAGASFLLGAAGCSEIRTAQATPVPQPAAKKQGTEVPKKEPKKAPSKDDKSKEVTGK